MHSLEMERTLKQHSSGIFFLLIIWIIGDDASSLFPVQIDSLLIMNFYFISSNIYFNAYKHILSHFIWRDKGIVSDIL